MIKLRFKNLFSELPKAAFTSGSNGCQTANKIKAVNESGYARLLLD